MIDGEDPREPVGVKELAIVLLLFVIVLMLIERMPG